LRPVPSRFSCWVPMSKLATTAGKNKSKGQTLSSLPNLALRPQAGPPDVSIEVRPGAITEPAVPPHEPLLRVLATFSHRRVLLASAAERAGKAPAASPELCQSSFALVRAACDPSGPSCPQHARRVTRNKGPGVCSPAKIGGARRLREEGIELRPV
jgi:hypothetical protein